MQPDYTYLLEKTGIKFPPIGLYDTPDPKPFYPVREVNTCLFAYFNHLIKGMSVQLTKEQYGCGGAGKWLCSQETRTLEEYVHFLADEEGLKANHDLMRAWLTVEKPYEMEYDHLILSTLVENEYQYLKTITFLVNPDQLSMLMIGAQLQSAPSDPEPVIAPFGSGCMQLITLFRDLSVPQTIIGATDMAMRRHLPADLLAFTTTRPMYELLCNLGPDSYLEKSFIKGLKSARSEQQKQQKR